MVEKKITDGFEHTFGQGMHAETTPEMAAEESFHMTGAQAATLKKMQAALQASPCTDNEPE